VPVVAPGLQETLAQFLSMFGTLAHAGLIPAAPSTSHTRGGAQTPVAHTLELRAHIGQVPGLVPAQLGFLVYPVIRAATYEEEQFRLVRFKKYYLLTFSGLASGDAHGFLEKCQHFLRTMGIMEMDGVVFTMFQLKGVAYQWWRTYELSLTAEATSLI